MAKARACIAAVCLVLMTAGSWAGQIPAAQPLTIADITATIGSDADALHVLAKVLSHAMANRSPRQYFLASQLRSGWLPVVLGVEFVCLADAEIAGHLSRCGVYWIIGHVERADNVVSISLAQKCGGSTRDYIVSFDGREWQLARRVPVGTAQVGYRE